MKGGKIFWGLVFVLLAVLLILDALGVLAPVTSTFGEITFWQIAGGLFLLCGVVSLIGSGEFWTIFVPLGFIFMMFERNIAHVCGLESPDIINNWLVFGCSLLLSAGFMFLIPKRKKKKKGHFKVCVNGNGESNSMSAAEKYIDCSTFEEEYFENKLGALEIRFENVDTYRGGGVLHVDNHLGATEIYIPSTWKLKHNIGNSLGSVEVNGEGSKDENAPTITITGDNHLGAIEIYIK